MDEKFGMGESVSEIVFQAINAEGGAKFDADKMAILKNEKEDAIYKTATFNVQAQEPYPSSFLTLSDTQIPKTTSEIFRWCKYFYTFDPIIAGAINALAAFPISEIYIEDKEDSSTNDESDALKTYKRVFFENLKIYNLLVGVGIDYFLYGNAFIFGEMYTNPNTNEVEWQNMIRLDPDRMIIDYNPVTQEKIFKWKVPGRIINIIKNKKPMDQYNKIPVVIRDAVRDNKAIVLNPKNIYHFARPTDSFGDNAIWGTPVIANVMKLLMYRNVLRQAQEAIAREHIVPMRVYYIQRTDSYNPISDWNNVATSFASELMRTVRDPNHKVVSPVPIGVINVGGEGRQLLVTPEIEQVQNEILAGMNVPREFIFGGVSYSGSSISLKILENQFITYRLLMKDFMQNFIIKNMAKARGEWMNGKDDAMMVQVKMVDLKMQDDVQQKNLNVELNRTGKVPDSYMWKALGMDPDRIKAMLKKEAENKIEEDAELQLKQMDVQFKIQQKQMEQQIALENLRQKLMPQPEMAQPEQSVPQQKIPQPENAQQTKPQGQPEQPAADVSQGVSDQSLVKLVQNLQSLKEEDQQKVIATLPKSYQSKIAAMLAAAKGGNSNIDMRPMPEKLPPRRDSLKS